MQKQALSLGRIMTMVLFALSCFGLLLFLWVVFGGATPLRAKGYRITAQFAQAGQLAQEADVRISGVPVGKVKSINTNNVTGASDVVLEIKHRYAPLPRNTRLRLRSKTLLGETYVELTPGDPGKGILPDGGRLQRSRVAPSVQLDEIISTFDARTRRAFQVWMQEQALAGAGRGKDISDTIAQFAPLEEQATELLRILDQQSPQLTKLVSGTGQVFASISARNADLASLIRNSNRVFTTIGRRDTEFADIWRAFPTFQRESRNLLTTLHGFINRTDPLITQLTPAFHELSRSFVATKALSPDLLALMSGVGAAQAAGEKGLPATQQFLGDLTPFFGALDPALSNLNPILGYVGSNQQDVLALVSNIAATTQFFVADDQFNRRLRSARVVPVINYDALSNDYPHQLPSARKNPYQPGGSALRNLQNGIPTYDTRQCTAADWPRLVDGPGVSKLSLDTLRNTTFFGTLSPIATPCTPAPKRGGGTQFPQLVQDATPTIP